MRPLTDQFTVAWGLAAGELKGIEIAQADPANAHIGRYGWRSIGVPTITAAAGTLGLAYLNAANTDAGRDNAEVLLIRQAKANAAPTYRSGAVVRGSGAAGAEEGYFCYLREEPVTKVFAAALTTTLVPEVGTGPSAFTRNLAGYFEDFEGVFKYAPANCARFGGARLVYNMVQDSVDLTYVASQWYSYAIGAGTAATCTAGATDPNGGSAAFRIQADRVGNTANDFSSWRGVALGIYSSPNVALSSWVKSNTGAAQTILLNLSSVDSIPATTDWARRAINGPYWAIDYATSGGFGGSESPIDVLAFQPQIEQTYGQSNTGPGEFVSVGALAWPHHGAGADGCKWYSYANATTVDANNLVTQAAGAAFADSTLKGVLIEKASVNYTLWNRDLTNAAWVKTNCTPAKTATSANGVINFATTLTATAANATCLQAIVRASAQRITGCRIKRRTGSGAIEMTQDNGATWTAVTVTAAWTRVSIPAATLANPTIGFRIVTSGDAVDIDFVQHEEAAYLSSDIPTTTAAVTRPADVLSFATSGNLPAHNFTLALKWRPVVALGAAVNYLWGSYVDASNYTLIFHDGTNFTARKRIAGVNYDATLAQAYAADTEYQIVARFSSVSGVQIFVDGVAGTPHANTTAPQLGTTFQPGAFNSAPSGSAYFRDVHVYDTALTDTEVSTVPRSATSSGTLVIAKLVAGALTELAGGEVALPTSEEDYYFRFRANGTSLKARAWRYDAPEPSAWAISITDATISAAGYVGLAFEVITADTAGFHVPGFISVGTNGESAPRPRSDIEIENWVNDDSNQRRVIARVGLLGQLANGTANASYALMANWPLVTRGSDEPANQVFDDIILEAPTIRASANEQLLGRSTLAYGDLLIANEDGVRDHWLRMNWDGRDCDLYMGGIGWRLWDFFRVLSGTIARIYAPKREQLAFKLRDRGVVLDRKLQTAVMGGSEADAGAPQPIALGKVFNAGPVLKDSTTRRLKFADADLTGATGITAVRDKGVAAAYSADLANGEFTLTGSDPVGRVTIDATVDLAGGSAKKAGGTHRYAIRTVIEDRVGLGEEACYLGARSGSLATFATAAQIGLYVTEERNVRDVLDDIAISAGGFWYPNVLGLYCAAQLRIPAAPYDHILIEDDLMTDIEIEDLWLPAEAEQLGYKRNRTPQDPDGLASGVSLADRALYAAAAQYTAIAPSYSGLDQPSNHILRRRLKNRPTLFYDSADAVTEADRMDAIFAKTCAIVRFTTRYNGPFYDLGQSLHLTHQKYGFAEGRAGVIVGFDKRFGNASAMLRLFVQLPGYFPTTTVADPHLSAEEFY